MQFVKFLVEDREAGQAYVRSHISTCIFVLDFLKHAKARGREVDDVEDLIAAMYRLHTQVISCRLVPPCGCMRFLWRPKVQPGAA